MLAFAVAEACKWARAEVGVQDGRIWEWRIQAAAASDQESTPFEVIDRNGGEE